MEIEDIIQSVEECHLGHYKENPVQEILNESWNEEEGTPSSILSRCQPTAQLVLNNSNISILTENLILTSAATVIPHIIQALDITCIISAAPELPDIPLNSNVKFHKVQVMDSSNSNISTYFNEVADVIEQEASLGGRTLVFCVAGVSRSASLCIAYLMKYHQLSLLEAYNYVKTRRPRIKPNCGFFKQLIEYEHKMYKSSTVKMVYNELVQMSIPDVYNNDYKVVRSKKFRQTRRQSCHVI